MVKHRSAWFFLLLLFIVGPRFADAVEWRLAFSPFFGFNPLGAENHYSSTTWEAYNEARGYVFATLMESNDTQYKSNPSMVGGEVKLTGWFTPDWGLSLGVGMSTIYHAVENTYNLDYVYYDGEMWAANAYDDKRSRLNRLWADLSVNHRILLGNRSAFVVSAGMGLHHLKGQIDHEHGWAAAIIADKYYVDYFLLPLNADFDHTFMAGQLGLVLEYRLSRVITAQMGVSGWLASKIRVPYKLDDSRSYYSETFRIELFDSVDLLSEEVRGSYSFNPSSLRFLVGFSFWL